MTHTLRNIIIIACISQLVSGCLAAGVAAATGLGGYMGGRYITKRSAKLTDREVDARDTYLMQQSKISADERLAATINSGLLRGLNKDLSVETSVKEGVVTLFGTAPNPDVADKIIDIARRTKGVQKVVPKLNVVSLQRGLYGGQGQAVPQQPTAPTAVPPYGQPIAQPQAAPAYGTAPQATPVTQPRYSGSASQAFPPPSSYKPAY